MPTPNSKNRSSLGALVIFFVALNLRPAIIAVGPLLSQIGVDLQWGESLQGLLGALPLLAFAALSFMVHGLSSRFGSDRTLIAALVLLAVGCALRSAFGATAVWLGTVLVGASIAVGNVLAPVIVKRDFPGHVSMATGVYSACVTAGSSIAGLLASGMADAFGGWRPALAFWAIPAVVAAVLWLARCRIDSPGAQGKCPSGEAEIAAASEELRAAESRATETGTDVPTCKGTTDVRHESVETPLWKRPTTWLVTAFMGLQSAAFYTFCNWLPSFAVSAGFSAGEAGIHLFAFQILGVVSGLVIPKFMYARGNQATAALVASVPMAVAAAGWMLIPQASFVWAVIGGFAQGASLVVALTLISLRGKTHDETVALSGIAQSFGYLLAACGPSVFGALAELTGGFFAPLAFMVALAVAQCVVGAIAGGLDGCEDPSRAA